MNKGTAILSALLLLGTVQGASAASYVLQGRVIGVTDGDTLRVLSAEKEQKIIRLAEIDAPELKGQDFGNRSKQSLSTMCFQKMASVEIIDTDRYGRLVGKVECDGVKANRIQVESGMAWAYRKYVRDASIIQLEKDAKAARRGLWADSDPVPPWVWRKSAKH